MTYPFPEGWSLQVVEHADGVTLLEVSGEIDAVTAEPLADTLRALLRPDETVVLDLTAVTYLGSRGLAEFVEAAESAGRTGSRLVLAPGTGNAAVLRPLQLTGLARVLDVREGSPTDITRAERPAPI